MARLGRSAREGGKPAAEPELPRSAAPGTEDWQPSVAVFLVLRRMRAPLVLLIVIFSVSVLGLTLIPGEDETGQPTRMTFFEAFYFLSYTATTIGFGELPNTFTTAQRLWVTLSIYLSVIGWAYAIGMVLSLAQDRGFQRALATQRFGRQVARLREPFHLLVGYGQAGKLVGHALDGNGRRFVALDVAADRVDLLELEAFRADVPGLVGDARVPARLSLAGLEHPRCAGVLALTDDDDANLAVAMTAALVRPGLPVFARAESAAIGERMAAFGSPVVVNPFDEFGDQLRVALRTPDAHRLRTWLTGPAGDALPAEVRPPPQGRWLVVGSGRFASEVVVDLRADAIDVVRIDLDDDSDGTLPAEALRGAVGLAVGADDDLVTVSVVEAARRHDPDLFVVAHLRRTANLPLFRALQIPMVVVPAEVVAQEVLACLVNPVLSRFLTQFPAQGQEWSAELLQRLVTTCGAWSPTVWQVQLAGDEAPAFDSTWVTQPVLLGALLRSPIDRSPLPVVTLMVLRGDRLLLAPDDDVELRRGDTLLLAGSPAARRALATSLQDDAAREYLMTGHQTPTTWIGRRVVAARGRGSSGPASR